MKKFTSMPHQIENINRDKNIKKRNEILELNSTLK